MTKANQILRDIKLAELLGHELKDDSKKIKDFIDDKLSDLIKHDKADYVYYIKNDEALFGFHGEVFYVYQGFFDFFYEDIKLKHIEIKKIIRMLILPYLNINKVEIVHTISPHISKIYE